MSISAQSSGLHVGTPRNVSPGLYIESKRIRDHHPAHGCSDDVGCRPPARVEANCMICQHLSSYAI